MIDPHDVTTIAAYALGALDDAEAAVVEEHLAICSRCRSELDNLAHPVGLLKAVPAELVLGDPSLVHDARPDDSFGADVPSAGLDRPTLRGPVRGGEAGVFDTAAFAEIAADLRALAAACTPGFAPEADSDAPDSIDAERRHDDRRMVSDSPHPENNP